MSYHVLFNLLNVLTKSDKMRGLPIILLLFRKGFYKSTNVKLYLSYDILKARFWRKNTIFNYVLNVVMDITS